MKPFIGFIKDTHLTQHNRVQVLNVFEQFIQLLLEHDIKYAVHFGDWFSERTGGHNIDRFTTVALIIRMLSTMKSSYLQLVEIMIRLT